MHEGVQSVPAERIMSLQNLLLLQLFPLSAIPPNSLELQFPFFALHPQLQSALKSIRPPLFVLSLFPLLNLYCHPNPGHHFLPSK